MQIKNKLRKHLIQLTKFICKSEWFTLIQKNLSSKTTKDIHSTSPPRDRKMHININKQNYHLFYISYSITMNNRGKSGTQIGIVILKIHNKKTNSRYKIFF